MLRKGDKCIYLPSGREVTVHGNQNSGERVAIQDLSQKPAPIFRVPPADVRRIQEADDEVAEEPAPVRPMGAWEEPPVPEPWDPDIRRCEDPACPVPHPHTYHGGRIS